MILLVSDTSVLIDLERGDLLPLAFASGMTMVVPDLLYDKELAAYNGPYFRDLGLQVVALTPQELGLAQTVSSAHAALSLPDCFALACATRPQHALLTSDGPLRAIAERQGVARYGLLWLLDRMAEANPNAHGTLHEGLVKIAKHPRCRQPMGEVRERLQSWTSHL